jgi:hypothetical protein
MIEEIPARCANVNVPISQYSGSVALYSKYVKLRACAGLEPQRNSIPGTVKLSSPIYRSKRLIKPYLLGLRQF